MDLILTIIVVFSALSSVFYSIKTRSYRKRGEYEWMRFYNAKGNIAMGSMLISMGVIQLFTFSNEVSGTRMFIGLIFFLLGAFNFFMGIRNYREYLPKISK
jgi:predicted membrane channel-forming protein YqfA (hemolysin III family)